MNDLKARLENEETKKWLTVVNELKRLGIDLAKEDKLNDALIDWGERLAQLREITGQVYTMGRPQIY